MRETLSHYGWLIATVIVISLIITFATPLGGHIIDGVKDIGAWLSNSGPNYEDDGDTPPALEMPKNLRVENGYLLFDEVEGARRYAIAINGETVATYVSEPKYNVSKYLEGVIGDIDIRVIAIDHYNEHSNSPAARLTYCRSGLFDKNDNLLASWEELVNDYGMDLSVNRHYPGCEYDTSIGGIIADNYDLREGVRLAVPGYVETIPDFFFYNADTLKDVVLCSGISTIKQYAFFDCDRINSIDLPETLTSISKYAFCSCDVLTSIELPTSLSAIEIGVFSGCENLENVIIPSGIKTIADQYYLLKRSVEVGLYRL